MAKGSVTALSLLATSDTINHIILIDRLDVYFWITEPALGWLNSYLSRRTHSVKVGNTLSHPAALHFGDPQGSVVRPILFSLYTSPIRSIIHCLVVSTTTFMLMTLNYTEHSHQL